MEVSAVPTPIPSPERTVRSPVSGSTRKIRVQSATKRIYSVVYSERFENGATIRAGELVREGTIGKVIQTVGFGPHRIHPPDRPDWFWDPARHGGIICDIASHQFDQFLFFTGSTSGEIVASGSPPMASPPGATLA